MHLAPSLRGARDKIAQQFCAEATKQSRVPPRKDSGLLRSARNDAVVRVRATFRSRAPDAAQRPRRCEASSGAVRCRAGAHLAARRAAPGSRLCAAALARCSASGTRVQSTGEPASPRMWRDRIGSTKNPLSTVARGTLMNQPRLVHKRRPVVGGSPPYCVLG